MFPALHVASSRRHNFVTGRKSLEVFVFTSAVRTCESSPRNTFVRRPSNQRHLGTVLSTTRTRSFTAKFRLFCSHFWRCCNVGMYSGIHWDQKQLAMNWACLHCLREYKSSLAKTLGGAKRFRLCKRRWFGVSCSISGWSLEGQKGRLFKFDVIPANTVRRVSEATRAPWLSRTAFIAFLTLLISFSQTPDMWLAASDWKRLFGSGHF